MKNRININFVNSEVTTTYGEMRVTGTGGLIKTNTV